jgi:hypothetical protein
MSDVQAAAAEEPTVSEGLRSARRHIADAKAIAARMKGFHDRGDINSAAAMLVQLNDLHDKLEALLS